MTVQNLIDKIVDSRYHSFCILRVDDDCIYNDFQDGSRVNGYDEYIKPFIPREIGSMLVECFQVFTDERFNNLLYIINVI